MCIREEEISIFEDSYPVFMVVFEMDIGLLITFFRFNKYMYSGLINIFIQV